MIRHSAIVKVSCMSSHITEQYWNQVFDRSLGGRKAPASTFPEFINGLESEFITDALRIKLKELDASGDTLAEKIQKAKIFLSTSTSLAEGKDLEFIQKCEELIKALRQYSVVLETSDASRMSGLHEILPALVADIQPDMTIPLLFKITELRDAFNDVLSNPFIADLSEIDFLIEPLLDLDFGSPADLYEAYDADQGNAEMIKSLFFYLSDDELRLSQVIATAQERIRQYRTKYRVEAEEQGAADESTDLSYINTEDLVSQDLFMLTGVSGKDFRNIRLYNLLAPLFGT